MAFRAAVLAICAALIAGSAVSAELRIGATHTLEDSGILPILLSAFTRARAIAVKPIVAGTG